jgi:ABC-2 type transport system ATP-binding protein
VPDACWPAIRIRALRRSFGAVRAVDGIDLDVPPGSLFVLIGPNGAGKSTTVRLLCGLIEADGGEVSVLGLDPARDRVALARRIGLVPDFPVLYEVLSSRDNVRRIASLRGLSRGETDRRLEELAHVLGMNDQLDVPVHSLSTGTRKKAALAAAMIHAPAVLFLDEPFEGIDPLAAHRMRTMLSELRARGTTIFVTSHVLPVVEALASHLAIVHEGRIVLGGPFPAVLEGRENLEQLLIEKVGADPSSIELPWYQP